MCFFKNYKWFVWVRQTTSKIFWQGINLLRFKFYEVRKMKTLTQLQNRDQHILWLKIQKWDQCSLRQIQVKASKELEWTIYLKESSKPNWRNFTWSLHQTIPCMVANNVISNVLISGSISFTKKMFILSMTQKQRYQALKMHHAHLTTGIA